MRFGPRARGPWRAAGIVYIAGWIIFAVGPVWILVELALRLAGEEMGSAFSLYYAMVVMLIGAAVVAAGWICHGIGLVMGAAAMPRA